MHPISKQTIRTTVADVIGTPDTWHDFSAKHEGKHVNMRGAVISEFAAFDDGIAISTRGGIDGPTYTVFCVDDAGILRRVTKVLEVGLNVHVAASLPI